MGIVDKHWKRTAQAKTTPEEDAEWAEKLRKYNEHVNPVLDAVIEEMFKTAFAKLYELKDQVGVDYNDLVHDLVDRIFKKVGHTHGVAHWGEKADSLREKYNAKSWYKWLKEYRTDKPKLAEEYYKENAHLIEDDPQKIKEIQSQPEPKPQYDIENMTVHD